jgi:hypothetical protein
MFSESTQVSHFFEKYPDGGSCAWPVRSPLASSL